MDNNARGAILVNKFKKAVLNLDDQLRQRILQEIVNTLNIAGEEDCSKIAEWVRVISNDKDVSSKRHLATSKSWTTFNNIFLSDFNKQRFESLIKQLK